MSLNLNFNVKDEIMKGFALHSPPGSSPQPCSAQAAGSVTSPQPREGNPLSTESKLLVETPLEESQEDAQVTGGGKPDKPLNRGRGRGRGLGEAKRGRGRPLSDLFIDYRCC